MNRTSKLPVRSLEPGNARESSRLSRADRRNRASSTSRVSNTISTPSLRRSKSSISLKRTPQSVSASRTRSSERNRIKRKDSRPIQDKTWQGEMLCKTQDYFQNDPEGSKLLNQGKSLRPLTIKMFTGLVNIVLCNIDERFEELTTTNYVEVLPKILSKLMYPGTVTSSMLKTAYTMHNWPHILAILSWLVDLHSEMQINNHFIEENLFILPTNVSNDELCEIKIQQLQSKVLMTAFVKWNQGQEEEFEDFSKGLREIYNIDDALANDLKQTVDHNTRQLHADEERIKQQYEDIKEAEAEHEKALESKKYMEDFVSQQQDYIKRLQQKIAEHNQNKRMLHDANESHKILNEKLEERIKKQPMSKKERKNRLRHLEELNAKKDLIIEERKRRQQISDDTDLRISQLKLKLDEKVSVHNMNLLQPSLKHPELKECTLKSGSVLGTEFYMDVEDKLKKLEKLDSDLEEQFKCGRHALVTTEKEHQQKQKEIDEISKNNEEVKLKTEEMKQKIESVLASDEEVKEMQNKIIESNKNKIKDVQSKTPNICKIKEMMKQKAEEYFALKKQREDSAQEMLKLSEKLENEVLNNIVPRYRAFRPQITASVEARRRNLIQLVTKSSDNDGASTSK